MGYNYRNPESEELIVTNGEYPTNPVTNSNSVYKSLIHMKIYCMDFLSPPRKILEYHLDYATAASCQIHSNPLFTNHIKIRRLII
jgi:hypothetical protein